MRGAINKAEVIEKKKNGCHRLSSPAISGYVSEMLTCQPPGNSLIKSMMISYHSNDYRKDNSQNYYAECYAFLSKRSTCKVHDT